MSNGNDGKSFKNISATTAPFALMGGTYGVTATAATWGTVTLQTLGPDGSTWIVALPSFTANGYGAISLPPGQYRFAIATATGCYIAIAGISR
jgi:hypothetical protein